MLDIISRYAMSLSGDIAEKMVLHPAYPAYPVSSISKLLIK
jgi:hypothetical protein